MGRAVSMGRPHLLRPLTEDRTCWTGGGLSEGIKLKTRRSATRSSVGPVRVNRLAPNRCLSPDTLPSKWRAARGGEACTVDHDVQADGLKASYPHSGTRPRRVTTLSLLNPTGPGAARFPARRGPSR